MTQREMARKGFTELWTEYCIGDDTEKASLETSLEMLMKLSADTPKEFLEWSTKEVPMFQDYLTKRTREALILFIPIKEFAELIQRIKNENKSTS